MENRLYPNLDPFYRFSNVEYGAEMKGDVSRETPDHRLHSSNTKRNRDSQNNILDFKETENTVVRNMPVVPSAPPLTEGSTSLLEALESFILEELRPPPYSPNDPLTDGDTWVDDLLPDYDISVDGDVDGLSQIYTLPVPDNAVGRVEGNEANQCSNVQTETSIRVNKKEEQTTNTSDRDAGNNMVIVTNRNLQADDHHHKHGKNNEYGAWVTWRKNVNRQLATVILLKRGGHVHLQKADLSRRPLSRTSMDYVISNAKNNDKGNALTTSLNGTPYIMYGIPRVALTKSPSKWN